MTVHDEVWACLGAWALDACDEAETRRVDNHLATCVVCRAEAARLRRVGDLIGLARPMAPPVASRSLVLGAASAQMLASLVDSYRHRVEGFASLLGSLSARDWAAPLDQHGDVRGVVAHLHANDRALLAALDPDADAGDFTTDAGGSTTDAAVAWVRQARRLADRMAAPTADLLSRQVPLVGRARVRRPVVDALVQRSFETWIHDDDVRGTLRLPGRPPAPAEVRRIVGLGVALIPFALAASGRSRPGRVAHLELTGPGGGRWDAYLALDSSGPEASEPVCGIVAAATGFCRVMAGRLEPTALGGVVTGDGAAAYDLLHAASTLGCD